MNLKQQIVVAAYNAGEGHIPSAFSILDIVEVLYRDILKPEDRFVLSKGHGCLALYAVLAANGIISEGTLDTFLEHKSILGGHPDRNKIQGVLCSTGSLGHGLPQAVGMALAKKIRNEPGRVFCLVGDGECNEGSIWESALLAAHHKLDNLTVIVDYNGSSERAVKTHSLRNKFEAFEFSAYDVDGHNQNQLRTMFPSCVKHPLALIAHTIKGNGCVRMVKPEWHHRVPTMQELDEILEELR